MNNILVTGGTGFIGSTIVDKLIEKGFNVYCIVRKKSNLQWLINKKVELIYSDFSNLDDIFQKFNQINYVVHVAGIIAALSPIEFYKINSELTNNLINSFTSYSKNPLKFIYISSQTVGGPAKSLLEPISEADFPNPLTNYAKSKLKAEEYIINYKDRINYTILRPAAVFGERDPGILQIFQLVKYGFGTIIGLKDKYLNLIYVEDLAIATINSINSSLANNEIYYIAGEEKFTWNYLLTQIKNSINKNKIIKIRVPDRIVLILGFLNGIKAKIINKPEIFSYEKAIDFTQNYWICDTTKAREQINLKTDRKIEDLLKKTADWYMQNGWIK